jgi:hypothetical protein
MRIGVPTEIKVHEYRVGLTPAGATIAPDARQAPDGLGREAGRDAQCPCRVAALPQRPVASRNTR